MEPTVDLADSRNLGRPVLKVIQSNLGKGETATQECIGEALSRRISVALLQEPYVGNKGIMSISQRVAQKRDATYENRIKAAIVVLNENVLVEERPDLVTENMVGIVVVSGGTRIGFVSFYWEDYKDVTVYINQLEHIIEELDTNLVIIGGDCNASSPWWGEEVEDERGTALMEFAYQHNLIILNEGSVPTFWVIRNNRECKSIVDVTLCTSQTQDRVTNWKVDKDIVTTSDHRSITFEVQLDLSTRANEVRKSTRLYNTKKADWELFREELQAQLGYVKLTEEKAKGIQTSEELNDIIELFSECVTRACKKAIPEIKQYKENKKLKWWTEELQEMKKNVIRWRRKISKANPRRKEHVVEKYKECLEQYKAKILSTRTESWRQFCTGQELESVWDKIYRILKAFGKSNEDILLKNNDSILNPLESAQLLARTFYPLDEESTDTNHHREVRNYVSEGISVLKNDPSGSSLPFTVQEMWMVIDNISAKKAPGSDGFTADICTRAIMAAQKVFLELLNRCLTLSCFPRIWKTATIRILRKPGKEDYTAPKSYRPIGLLPVFGKILEKMFVNRLLWQLGNEGKIVPRQYGFMPQVSTEDALYDAVNRIRQGVKDKEIVALVSLDIEGAFDNAWWPAVQKELLEKEVDREVVLLIDNYLSERSVSVQYAGNTVYRDTNKGCIQGSTCGPIMWNIQLDPLLRRAERLEAHVQAFADDILIIASAKNSAELVRKVNEALEEIAEWGRDSKMRFAAHKTQAVIFTNKLKYDQPSFELNGIQIPISAKATVLGVVIDRNLNFKDHLDKTTRKAIVLYQSLSKATKATWGLDSQIVRTLYTAVIEPIVLYAASVWAPAAHLSFNEVRLNRITRMFAILITRAHRTSSLVATTLLGRILPLNLRVKEAAEVYEAKRGKPIQDLPGRLVEKRVHPFQLPYPAKRTALTFGILTTEEDVLNIKNGYPKLFTDGSKIEGKVGGATVCFEEGIETHYRTFKLEDYCSVYQAELAAIVCATDMTKKRKWTGVNIISDSRSALEALKDTGACHPLVVEAQNKIADLKIAGKHTNLFWIKAHAGIQGNERADELAKEAALKKKTAPVYDGIPVSFIKREIRIRTLDVWQQSYGNATTGAVTRLFFGDVRQSHKILGKMVLNNRRTQMFTGHGGFAEYLHRFKLKDSPYCDCDGSSTQDVVHLLDHCAKFSRLRYDTEAKMGCKISKDTYNDIIKDDLRRPPFLKYLDKIAWEANKSNGSKCTQSTAS